MTKDEWADLARDLAQSFLQGMREGWEFFMSCWCFWRWPRLVRSWLDRRAGR